MNNNRYCVIMAGGNVDRFWPLSRESKPKQFLDISGTGKSFIRMTYDRFSSFIPQENILVVALGKHEKQIKEQLPELQDENLLLEPYSRNTAPCLAYSTYSILKRNPNATIVATPADHYITDDDQFKVAIERIMDYAENKDVLMTLGIRPTSPDTNYGYIQVSGGKTSSETVDPVKVKTFTEKPDKELAEVFYNSQEFYWNSGIFAWKASLIKDELEKYVPEVTNLFSGWEDALSSPQEKPFIEKTYGDCPKISIDYGVMEKTEKAWLLTGDFGWSDIDSWDALYNNIPGKDSNENLIKTSHSLLDKNKNCLVFCKNDKKLYAIKGLENYIVVDTEDALLICPKDDKQCQDLFSELGMPAFKDFR